MYLSKTMAFLEVTTDKVIYLSKYYFSNNNSEGTISVKETNKKKYCYFQNIYNLGVETVSSLSTCLDMGDHDRLW